MDVPPASPPEPSTGLLVVAAPIRDGDVAVLCERLRTVLATSDAEVVVCDVGALPANVSRELEQLLAFAGLADVVAVGSRLRGRSRHAEEREHPCRVEERVDGDDPPV
jgi:hypothetical protein